MRRRRRKPRLAKSEKRERRSRGADPVTLYAFGMLIDAICDVPEMVKISRGRAMYADRSLMSVRLYMCVCVCVCVNECLCSAAKRARDDQREEDNAARDGGVSGHGTGAHSSPKQKTTKKKFYVKKSTQRVNELYERYKKLAATNKLGDYVAKKRRRTAAKLHTMLPRRRGDDAAAM